MKKILSILLALMLTVSLVPTGIFTLTVGAETEGYYTYTVSDEEATITGVVNVISGDIVIPSTLGGYPVTKIADSAFYSCRDITSVTIPDGIKSIGESAFSRCSSLASITIPDSVTNIGAFMLSGCNSIEKVILPFLGRDINDTDNGIRYLFGNDRGEIWNIGEPDFDYYPVDIYIQAYKVPNSLKEVVITKATRLNVYAFCNSAGLTTVTIPNSLETIEKEAFYGCDELTDVYYDGSENDKNNISFANGNECLKNATWHYTCCLEHIFSNFYDSLCNKCGWNRGEREPTTVNLLEMQQNILGIKTLSSGHFDMNFDKKVDSTDLSIIQMMILGL